MPRVTGAFHKCGIAFILPLIVSALFLPSLAAGHSWRSVQESKPPDQSDEQSGTVPGYPVPPSQPGANYHKDIFLKPIPADQLAFLSHFAGASSNDVIRDKQFRKLMKSFVPDCTFHYGTDMSLNDALDKVIENSNTPFQLRDGRYAMIAGRSGPYLGGKGFLWIDTQDGIGLGGFYFHPSNGEPTPVVIAFSRQVREKYLALSQLPPAFVDDLKHWTAESYIAPVTTRYFISGGNEKILLEHDEDFCAPTDQGAAPPDVCQQMNSQASDVDVTAAYYLEQINHATNGTEWMIDGEDQAVWVQTREQSCGGVADPIGCRIHATRERTHVIIHRAPIQHVPRGPRR
jgi:hypothetical protein